MAKVINFWAGPGAGKSSTMAQIFALLKWEGVNCEMAPEFAKELVWGKRFNTLDDQLYVFAKQHHRLWRLKDQVDVILTDSPLPLSIIYDTSQNMLFHDFVMDRFNQYDNINYFLERTKPYNPAGRMQTEKEANGIDIKIKYFLMSSDINHTAILATRENIGLLKTGILNRL